MTTDGTKPSMATKLIELALRECVEFWHDESNDGFADFRSNGHLESMKIRSTGFRQFLRKLFFVENETAANNQAIAEAIDTLDGKAVFQGQRFKCNVRIGHLDGDIFLDLGNKHWQVIHISGLFTTMTKSPSSLFAPRHYFHSKCLLAMENFLICAS